MVRALVTLMREGGSLGDPLVVSAAGSWAWALSVALDRSYQERLDRQTALRGGEADAATLVKDIQDHVADLTILVADDVTTAIGRAEQRDNRRFTASS